MNNKKVDLNLFRVLEAIYTHGSTTQAAKALGLSQPAVSHALARLRDQFDDQLFVRRGARMAPTPHTITIMSDVQRSLAALHGTLQANHDFDPQEAEREFKIGFRDVLESICFPVLLSRLGDSAPGLRFASLRMSRDQIERELATGAIDVAVDALHPVSGEILTESLGEEPFAVVGRKSHPAFDNGPDLGAYLAARHTVVTVHGGADYIDFVLQKQNHQRTIALHCQHYFAACQVAASTDLLLTMPQTYAAEIARSVDIDVHAVPFKIPPIDIRLYWHQRSDNEPANHWLREAVAATIRKSLMEVT